MSKKTDVDSPNAYTTVIDLTTRAQEVARQEKAVAEMADDGNTLPPLSIDELPERVRRAVDAIGWKQLMNVQQRTMPYMLAERDLIVQSRTGSGKTGAFLLPLFDRIDADAGTQVLILTPTRELARQIDEEFGRMANGAEEAEALRVALIYGGKRYAPQIKALKDGAQLVIGTPGRILDHLERGTLSLDALRFLILDEADEMLSMGFYPAMRQLKRYLPSQRNSYMFSATMPPKVQSLAREFLHEPGFLALSTGQVGVDAIEHRYYVVPPMEKDRTLVRLIEMENPDSSIIFTNTKREVEYLTAFLKNYGYDADAISGDLSQRDRERVMDRIRRADLRFLVATDVAARGIDISDLSHVFMYDVPQDPEYYIHRSGRTARAGKTGKALVLTTTTEKRQLLAIAQRYAVEIAEHDIPSTEDVADRVAERMTVVLEDMLRACSKADKKAMQVYVAPAAAWAKAEPMLLAMLVDHVYHQHLHRPIDEAEQRPTFAFRKWQGLPEAEGEAATEETLPDPVGQMQTALEDLLAGASNLQRERMRRFGSLVEELGEEEPELLALLVDQLAQTPGYVPPPPAPRESDDEGGEPRNKRNRNRNRNRGRNRGK